MLDRYEWNITPAKLLSQLNLQYSPGNEPPQLAVKKLNKQAKSGKKKKSAKKTEKLELTEKLRKNDSSLFVPPQLTENLKSETKKPLDYSSILDINAVPELMMLIENISKHWGEIGGTSGNDKINNNENIISEGATNYSFVYNSFDKEEASSFTYKDDASSSADNQSSSESDSSVTVDNLQNTTNEISKFADSNYGSNLVNGSSDLILFADGNNIPNNEIKEENILNSSDSESAFEDNLHCDFFKKSASVDHNTVSLETCDLPTCDKTENISTKYSFNAEALSKHVNLSEDLSYINTSLVQYRRCVNDDKLMIENNSLTSSDATENVSKPCTTYSFTAETLAEHILAKHAHAVQDSDCCNALVEYKNHEYQQVNENCVGNRSSTSCAGENSQSLNDSLNENLLSDFVLINGSLHSNQSCVIQAENDFSLLQDVVTSESEKKLSNLSLLLPQCEESECLLFNQENQKQDTVFEENSDLSQTEIVDKIACFAPDFISEELKKQNRNVELIENVSKQNSDSSEINLVGKGTQFYENTIVQARDCNSIGIDNNKIVNTHENKNDSQKSVDEIVNVNENLLGTKSECYSDKKIDVDDEASNSATQKVDCINFSTVNEKTCGDLSKNCNKSQKNSEEVDCLTFDVKSYCYNENSTDIGMEQNQSVNKENSEETIGSDRFFLDANWTIKNENPGTSGIRINSNSIQKDSIKINESEGNCSNVSNSGTSNACKVTLIQYLLEKQVKNNNHCNDKIDSSDYNNDKTDSSDHSNNNNSTDDILNKNQPELSPNLSSSSDKDCYEIATEEFEGLLDPVLDGSLIQNFDILAYLSDKSIKTDAVSVTADKNVDESLEEYKECLHTMVESEHERKTSAAAEDSVLEEWEKRGESWDESNSKETEKDVGTEVDDTVPKPARDSITFRARNICGSPINLIENISDSCDWDTIDNPSFNWNSADTVQKIENGAEVKPQEQRDFKPKPMVVDQSTNTCYTDFNLLHHDDSDEATKEKILFSKNRNICEGKNPSVNVYKPNFLTFDKSTMTGDDLAFGTKLKYDFQQLVEMFPETELGSLMELVDRCDGNLDWAADVLADSERNTQLTVDNSFHKTSDVPVGSCDAFKESSFARTGEPPADVLVFDAPSHSVRQKKSTKQEKKCVSESQLELKKLIESTFVLDKSHYSEHVWKIKKKKNGDYAKKDSGSDKEDDGNFYTYLQEPEDSDFLNTKSDTEDESSEYEVEYDDERDKIGNVEDASDDDLEEGSSATEDEEELVSDAEADDEEGTLKLTFDWNLIMELQKTFGNPLPDIKGLKPEVELPLSLACQLHSYVVESLIRQVEQQQEVIDQMIAEDNAFAWQLQQQEEEQASTSEQQPVPQLQEIMDMEMALALYRADQEEWKQQSQDSMADRLSKKLLLEKFPQVDCNVLMEMFYAHNCSLHDTVTTLSMSLSVDEPGLVKREMELLANAKEEKIKIKESKETTLFTYAPNDGSRKHMLALKEEAGNMRVKASRYYELRSECFTKAQDMYRTGNRSVASYYSHLAELYKEKIDLCNSQAAAYLLYARTNSRTLDLHFLRTAEAEQVLNLFLDESIAQLREKQKSREVLYVITGRGLHSEGGVSRNKSMVTCRLRKRKIKFSEVEGNPGMLRAKITKNTQLSHK